MCKQASRFNVPVAEVRRWTNIVALEYVVADSG